MATHFLHIPIATPFSIQRIQDVLLRLARDPLAAALPPVAWQTARELHYPLLALDLKTEDQVQDAIQLLGSPKARSIVKECGNLTATTSGLSQSSSTVTLHGLTTANINLDDVDKTPKICMYLVDSTLNFLLLQRRLLDVFRNLSFKKYGQPAPIFDHQTPFIKIMDNRYMRTELRNTKFQEGGSRPCLYRKPLYDARDLYMKYKDHTWIKNLEIETLSISETGIRDIIRREVCIGQGYREIARVPLPGITEGMLEPGEPDDRYIGAKKRHEEKMPVKPLWLSLKPQHEAPDLTPKSVLRRASVHEMT